MRFLNGIGRLVGLGAFALAAGLLLNATAAFATGMSTPGQMGFQEAVTPVMEDIESFHHFLLIIVTSIVVLVSVLLLYVIVRFNRKSNPVPSKTSHNTLVEVVWTVLPVLILVVIAIPSFRLLYKQLVIPQAEMTIKATGNQWYWGYEYPDNGDLSFDANMVPTDELNGRPRLLATDNAVVVPIDTTVRVIVTAGDVIHAWAVPAFGVKIDAVPGRLNETWFRATKEGIYYGQCSELCGQGHAFMPIEVHVVSKEDFAAWVEKTKTASRATPDDHVKLAQSHTGTVR
ncbi:MAG: cytochrome c oxidase subunit II [Parvibaculum sp.]|jgi:cytochrome c oxidase subunit 2|uniref:cytochrome c oxidase subunit II n=1 Tax=Parvibaculum sp. TaxID=2024848 RepID=UPI003C718215